MFKEDLPIEDAVSSNFKFLMNFAISFLEHEVPVPIFQVAKIATFGIFSPFFGVSLPLFRETLKRLILYSLA